MKKAHQRIIREEKATEIKLSLFNTVPETIELKNAVVKRINYITAQKIIIEYEWIGSMPLPKSCRFMYGIYFDGICGGCVVYVEPSTRQFNELYPRQAVQLNRGACVHWTPKNSASYLISRTIKDLKKEGVKIIIAYCTQEAGEIGTIYQALGWDYVGNTTPSYTYYLDGYWVSSRTLADKVKWAKNKSIEWVDKFRNLPKKKVLEKYRYVKLIGTKSDNEKIREVFGFYPLEYPKR